MAVVEHHHEGLLVVVDGRLDGCELADGQGEVSHSRGGPSEVTVVGARDLHRRVVASESPAAPPTLELTRTISRCRSRMGARPLPAARKPLGIARLRFALTSGSSCAR